LLNASLTVEKNKPNSHYKFWEEFTNDTIQYIDMNNKNCVFLLLGNFAKNKKKFITNNNMVVEGVHPSPLSAFNGFFNSNIFSKIENILGYTINWQN
jgi:uracil-DNA glycosylase